MIMSSNLARSIFTAISFLRRFTIIITLNYFISVKSEYITKKRFCLKLFCVN